MLHRLGTVTARAARHASFPAFIRQQRYLSSAGARTPHILSDIGEGITEVEVVKFFVKEGDEVTQFQPLVEVQSDKATVEISSRYDGVVDSLGYEPGDIAAVGTPLCYIRTSDDVLPPAEDQQDQPVANTSADESVEEQLGQPHTDHDLQDEAEQLAQEGKVLATPAVRGLARELGVDIGKVIGTGKAGRVTANDVHDFLDSQTKIDGETTDESSAEVVLESPMDLVSDTEVKTEPIRGLQRGMMKSMTAAAEIAQLGLTDEVNMDSAMSVRKQIKAMLSSEADIKFTFMPLFIKAISMSLLKYPILNATLDVEGEKVVYNAHHNISIAMSTEKGLVVPNIKRVETLSMLEIAEELKRLEDCGKAGRFSKQDLSDGTFSFSNIGSIGGVVPSPVVFPPQVAIGAIGSIQKRATVQDNGSIGVANIVSVSWAADHRIIDGATMAMFNKTWKQYMEHPQSMLLTLK